VTSAFGGMIEKGLYGSPNGLSRKWIRIGVEAGGESKIRHSGNGSLECREGEKHLTGKKQKKKTCSRHAKSVLQEEPVMAPKRDVGNRGELGSMSGKINGCEQKREELVHLER